MPWRLPFGLNALRLAYVIISNVRVCVLCLTNIGFVQCYSLVSLQLHASSCYALFSDVLSRLLCLSKTLLVKYYSFGSASYTLVFLVYTILVTDLEEGPGKGGGGGGAPLFYIQKKKSQKEQRPGQVKVWVYYSFSSIFHLICFQFVHLCRCNLCNYLGIMLLCRCCCIVSPFPMVAQKDVQCLSQITDAQASMHWVGFF